nr:bet1-like SNARE 1-1 [Ipomoea batatas]GMD69407.1 bet1-like SNARE 1-1 [Ipomoea batatas]GMD98725.1 bet1-like SNARE 1-1 [Ipomoea batatas]
MNFRDCKARTALFDGIEEGGIRASLSYSSHEIDEHENEKALEGLKIIGAIPTFQFSCQS